MTYYNKQFATFSFIIIFLQLLCNFFFILMINDLRASHLLAWKYADNTTIAEMVPKGGQSNIQSAVNAIQD